MSQNLGVIKIRIYPYFWQNFGDGFQDFPRPIMLKHPCILAAVCEGVHIMFINLAIPMAVANAVDPRRKNFMFFFPEGKERKKRAAKGMRSIYTFNTVCTLQGYVTYPTLWKPEVFSSPFQGRKGVVFWERSPWGYTQGNPSGAPKLPPPQE